MKEKVIAIFDIGKTNKKILLFNYDLKLISEIEGKFDQIKDDDGFECDNIEFIEKWIRESILGLLGSEKYELTAVNFTTYGATLAYLDEHGKRLTPIYNYLKPIPDNIPNELYKKYGGKDEFCRRTASPALGMLNSGLQALWLKRIKPEIFNKVKYVLHFPQYLSYCLTGKIFSEHTSVGCHTAMWDFDNSAYHPWIKDEDLDLPLPTDIGSLTEIKMGVKKLKIGKGIHDSSASLAPYFAGSKGNFLLVSTGTWCINMNPFNSEKLTASQLSKDCLCYLSITQQPVKSSRLFLGHFHDSLSKVMSENFKVPENSYKNVKPDFNLVSSLKNKYKDRGIFFKPEPDSREINKNIDFSLFKSFDEGYHQLMIELCNLTIEAINLVIPSDDKIENIYITGGFSKNELFVKMIASAYPSKKIYTSEINNATALGAALVILNSLDPENKPVLNLGLKEWSS